MKNTSPLLPTLRKLKRLAVREGVLAAQLKEERGELNFSCVCGAIHRIKECEAIQTHWYTSPSGCTDGDYWNEGELQIVCPVTKDRNRVLVSYDVNKLEEQFSDTYKSLFKSVIETHGDNGRLLTGSHWNNYFLTANIDYYGLKLKEKS